MTLISDFCTIRRLLAVSACFSAVESRRGGGIPGGVDEWQLRDRSHWDLETQSRHLAAAPHFRFCRVFAVEVHQPTLWFDPRVKLVGPRISEIFGFKSRSRWTRALAQVRQA